MSDAIWRIALAKRGLLSAKIGERLAGSDGKRIEMGAPETQPYRRNFSLIVSRAAAAHFGPGNYRMESLKNPSRVAVWKGPALNGVAAGTGMTRRTVQLVRDWQERRL